MVIQIACFYKRNVWIVRLQPGQVKP
jgi:hypothetical protein